MKNSFKKFRSCSGASMIIALVFMLVAVFVGGSVLVAATVNANRIANDRETQQGILNQRSACSVFAEILTDENGKIDISLPYTVPVPGTKSPSNPYDPDTNALKYVICEAAKKTINNGLTEQTQNFTITDPDGNTLNCVAVCKSDYTVYLQFRENPQVQLRLLGRDEGDSISWYSGRIIKAERL